MPAGSSVAHSVTRFGVEFSSVMDAPSAPSRSRVARQTRIVSGDDSGSLATASASRLSRAAWLFAIISLRPAGRRSMRHSVSLRLRTAHRRRLNKLPPRRSASQLSPDISYLPAIVMQRQPSADEPDIYCQGYAREPARLDSPAAADPRAADRAPARGRARGLGPDDLPRRRVAERGGRADLRRRRPGRRLPAAPRPPGPAARAGRPRGGGPAVRGDAGRGGRARPGHGAGHGPAQAGRGSAAGAARAVGPNCRAVLPRRARLVSRRRLLAASRRDRGRGLEPAPDRGPLPPLGGADRRDQGPGAARDRAQGRQVVRGGPL